MKGFTAMPFFLCLLLACVSRAAGLIIIFTECCIIIIFAQSSIDTGAPSYDVKIEHNNTAEVITFDDEGAVTHIDTANESYSIQQTDGAVEKVTYVGGGRTLAEEEEENAAEELHINAVPEIRRLSSCDDCLQEWETLCSNGLESVCNLANYGELFMDDAVVAIDTLCETFGNECSEMSAVDACRHDCDDHDDSSSTP